MQRTSLEKSRLSRPYRQRLLSALRYFVSYLHLFGLTLDVVCESARLVETHLAEFVQCCHDERRNIWIPRHAIFAIQHLWRPYRGKLRRAWDGIQSWQLTISTFNRLPMPLEVLDAVVVWSALRAVEFPHAAPLLYAFGVCLRLGFLGLLRPGEIFRLTFADVRLPLRGSVSCAITGALRDTKNRRFLGRSQFFMINDLPLLKWLTWFSAGREPSELLWAFGSRVFGDLLKLALECLGLSGLGYTPGSLRSGGTTHLFATGVEIARIKFLGRWMSERSVGSYVQECMARFVWSGLAATVAEPIVDLGRRGQFILSSPPPVPWRVVFSQGSRVGRGSRNQSSTAKMLRSLRTTLLD